MLGLSLPRHQLHFLNFDMPAITLSITLPLIATLPPILHLSFKAAFQFPIGDGINGHPLTQDHANNLDKGLGK